MPAKLAEWKVAFIEDCEDLHLVRKPSFASAIQGWLQEEEVRAGYERDVVGGRRRLVNVAVTVEDALVRKGGLADGTRRPVGS